MSWKKWESDESLGVKLTAFSFVVGLIYGVVILLIFGPMAKMATKDWGVVHLLACIFFPALVTTAVYHNIWIRQLLLPAALVGAIYSYLKFHGSDLKISLTLCVLAVVTMIWMGIVEARTVTGKMSDFWRSFLFHPTRWAEEFKKE